MHVLSLESFDEAPDQAPEGADAFQDGFLAGFTQAQSEAEMAQETLKAELVQAVSDMQFTYIEAREDFVHSIAPLLTAITERVLPACIEATFQHHIHDALITAAKVHAPHSMTVTVHPSQRAALAEAFSQNAQTVEVTEDTNLGMHAARVGHQSGEVLIDLDRLSLQIAEILSALSETSQRTISNG